VFQHKLVAAFAAGLFAHFRVELVKGEVFLGAQQIVNASLKSAPVARLLFGHARHSVLEASIGQSLCLGNTALFVELLVFQVTGASLAGELVAGAAGALDHFPLEHLFQGVLDDKVGHVEAGKL